MFAIDTNILVHAHNTASPLHERAKQFVEDVMNARDDEGGFSVCIPAQILMEFIHVVTWQRLEAPLLLGEARDVVEEYLDTGVPIVARRENHLRTFLELLRTVASRKKVFDVALAATLKDHGIEGLYTLNVADFAGFDFIKVVNPLAA